MAKSLMLSPWVSIILISFSLALDAASVSVAGGIKTQRATGKDAFKVAVYFGVFQAVMPLIGWAAGTAFRSFLSGASKWTAFILLAAIGAKMVYEAFGADNELSKKDILDTKTLIVLALATSIDALVVGFTLNLIALPLFVSVSVIGVVTFGLSLLGYLFGRKVGSLLSDRAEAVGGVVLILLGLKILLLQ